MSHPLCSYVCNRALTRVFPDHLKTSVVKQTIEKGDQTCMRNYRPVVLLTFFFFFPLKCLKSLCMVG
jgi:hypothetical protein